MAIHSKEEAENLIRRGTTGLADAEKRTFGVDPATGQSVDSNPNKHTLPSDTATVKPNPNPAEAIETPAPGTTVTQTANPSFQEFIKKIPWWGWGLAALGVVYVGYKVVK